MGLSRPDRVNVIQTGSGDLFGEEVLAVRCVLRKVLCIGEIVQAW
jgi:hypothetical protein